MKRNIRRVGALVCAAVLALSLVPGAAAAASPAVSDNINDQDYTTWSTPVTSYLMENGDGGLTRVEYIDGQIVVEDYSSQFQFQSSRTIPMELSIWGGFFAGADANFFVFGQKNPSESDSTEVIRVVKYSKNWQRQGQASLYGANTTVPFDAGSLRMDEYGGYLYIRTSHEMYTTSDGLNHQANLTMAVRQSDMTVTDSFYKVMNADYGYVSHSFNQFILVDQEGRIVTLDHGDAYPRAMTFMRYYADAATGKFTDSFYNGKLCSVGEQRTFAGTIGANTTGASVGGLAETSGCYMMAYNYDGVGGTGPRNVYLQAMDIATGRGKDYQITQSGGSTTPVLAPTGLNGGYLLWNSKENYTVSDTLYYLHYGADGVPSQYQTAQAPLSDCQPIPWEDGVVWYVTDNSVPTFYTLDGSGVTAHTTTGETTEPDPTPDPTPDPGTPGGTEALLPESNHTVDKQVAVLDDGTMVIWGSAKEDTSQWNEELEVVGSGFTAVSQFGVDFLGLKADGTLWAWGYGKGAVFTREPTQILDNVKQLRGPMALKNDGTVWYALSASYVTDQAKQISYDGYVGIILKNDGTVYSYIEGDEPALKRAPLQDVRYVSGYMAILDNGELWYWGRGNMFGISGTGDEPLSGEPVKVMDGVVNVWGENISDIIPSAFALTEDGSLYSWGLNHCGQLGYSGGNREYPLSSAVFGENAGTLPYQDTPKRVDISDVADVVPAGTATFVLKTDGTLWAVGYNIYSQALLPQEIERVDTFTKVLSGVMLPGKTTEASDPETKPGESAGQTFTDVPENAWYASYVNTAAKAGLMQGTGGGQFSPDRTLSLAEVVTLTARLHAEENGGTVPSSSGEWYQGAYDYCVDNGLFTAGEVPVSSLAETATRFQMVDLLDRAVPESKKAPIHSNVTIPDLTEGSLYGDVVYSWYRAGLISGDQNGRFNGNSPITRGETAVIFCRLAGLV